MINGVVGALYVVREDGLGVVKELYYSREIICRIARPLYVMREDATRVAEDDNVSASHGEEHNRVNGGVSL